MTCRDWCRNLSDELGRGGRARWASGTAKVWALYLAGSRLSFERNRIQLHQILGVKVPDDGNAQFPLRPTWGA